MNKPSPRPYHLSAAEQLSHSRSKENERGSQRFLCISVYDNGDIVKETLDWNVMMAWSNYNRLWRPGVALFVDSDIKQAGYLSDERCAALVANNFEKEKRTS